MLVYEQPTRAGKTLYSEHAALPISTELNLYGSQRKGAALAPAAQRFAAAHFGGDLLVRTLTPQTLGYLSPSQYEAEHAPAQAA